MKKSDLVTTVAALFLFAVSSCYGQTLERTVGVLELEETVTVPAGDVLLVVFWPGSAADPSGPTPPNGDFVIHSGNFSGPVGYIATFSCGVPDFTDPGILFPCPNFLIAGADANLNAVLSNHSDVSNVGFGLGVACIIVDSDGDGLGDQHADNAYAQELTAAVDTDVANVLVGIDTAIEGNSLIDTDNDGVGDTSPIIDGKIPAMVYFYFGATAADVTFNALGPDQPADAESMTYLVLEAKPCPSGFERGDCNQDGEISLLDVAPFVSALKGDALCEADVDQNGVVDLLDVQPFIELLTGG